MKVCNGDRVQDLITGFEGVVTGKVAYITGCNQLLVQPPAKDGEYKEARWIDEDRCQVLVQAAVELSTVSSPEHPGFDDPPPVR